MGYKQITGRKKLHRINAGGVTCRAASVRGHDAGEKAAEKIGKN